MKDEDKMISMISNKAGLDRFPGGYSRIEKLEDGMYRVWMTKEQYEKVAGNEVNPFSDGQSQVN